MAKPKQSELCRALAIEEFEQSLFPGGPVLDNTWLGIYQVLLWWASTDDPNVTVPHIIDADKFKHPRKSSSIKPTLWRRRAEDVATYLSQQLEMTPSDLPQYFDRLMRTPEYLGAQRQNPLGIAFAALVKHVIEKYHASTVRWETEVKASTIFPGIQLPGRSDTASIDVIGFDMQAVPVALISSKYSLRHDRVADITNECPIYKAASNRFRRPLPYYVVTAEFDPARLSKIIDDPCVDAVVHVHKALITEVLGLNGRMKGLVDLTDFVRNYLP